MALSEKLLKLKEQQKADSAKGFIKNERVTGTFGFIGKNGNGTFQWELEDMDGVFVGDPAFNTTISVTKDEHQYLQQNKGVTLIYITKKPRTYLQDNPTLGWVKGATQTTEDGDPIYGLKLDNPVTKAIDSLFDSGVYRSDMNETATRRREMIENNPEISKILAHKSRFGLLRNNNAAVAPGTTIADLKPTEVNVDNTVAKINVPPVTAKPGK